jgi:hypothetical protein
MTNDVAVHIRNAKLKGDRAAASKQLLPTLVCSPPSQHRAGRHVHPDVAREVSRALLASVHRAQLHLPGDELDAGPPDAVPSRILRRAWDADPPPSMQSRTTAAAIPST